MSAFSSWIFCLHRREMKISNIHECYVKIVRLSPAHNTSRKCAWSALFRSWLLSTVPRKHWLPNIDFEVCSTRQSIRSPGKDTLDRPDAVHVNGDGYYATRQPSFFTEKIVEKQPARTWLVIPSAPLMVFDGARYFHVTVDQSEGVGVVTIAVTPCRVHALCRHNRKALIIIIQFFNRYQNTTSRLTAFAPTSSSMPSSKLKIFL